MLQTLIQLEQERFAKLGYGSVVTMDEITVFDNHCVIPVGNDSIIITKFVFDEDSVYGDNPRISLCSPAATINGTVRNLSNFGAGTFKVMRDYITINRWSKSTGDSVTLPLSIQVVRISPVSNNN